MIDFFDRIENIVGKGENTGYQDNIFALSELTKFANNNFIVAKMVQFLNERVENLVRK